MINLKYHSFISEAKRVTWLQGGLPKWLSLSTLLLLCLVIANTSYAATSSSGTLDDIVDLYRQHAASWESSLRNAATSLFWILATIDFTWTGIKLTLRHADFSEWLADFTNQILFIGFFYALLMNSSTWSRDIVNAFMQAASQASSAASGQSAITPSNVFDVGLNLAHAVMTQLSLFSPAESLGLMIASLIIVICFALIAAFMVITLVEAYVVMSAGVFFMGFGGSRWTQEYAMKMISYTVSVGAKLFVLQLLIGLGESMIESWVGTFDAKDQNIFIMVGSSIVMLALTKSIPELVQSLISGASVTHGSALTGAAGAAIQTAATVAGGAIGAGMAGRAASKLAGMQVASAAARGESPGSRMGLVASNLASAGAQDVGRRLSGQAHHGTSGARMAGSMDYKAAEIKADMDKPTPPTASQAPEAQTDNNRIYI